MSALAIAGWVLIGIGAILGTGAAVCVLALLSVEFDAPINYEGQQ